MMTMIKGYFLMVTIRDNTLLDSIRLPLVPILQLVVIRQLVVILQLKGIHQPAILLRGIHNLDTLDTLPKGILQQVILEDHLLHITQGIQGMDLAWGHCLLEVLQQQRLRMAHLIWPMVLIWDMVATHTVAIHMVALDMENSSMASMESMVCMAMENSSMANMESMGSGCTVESSRSGSKSVGVMGRIDSDCCF